MERLTYRLNDQCDNPTDSIILKPYLRYEDPETRKKILNRIAAYEDSGLEPEDIADFMKRWERAVEIAGICKRGGIDHLLELKKAEQDGRLVVLDEKTALSMYAGARAIENNKRLFGATYVYDVFGKQGGPKEIPYFDAANNLRNIASAMSLKGGEG